LHKRLSCENREPVKSAAFWRNPVLDGGASAAMTRWKVEAFSIGALMVEA